MMCDVQLYQCDHLISGKNSVSLTSLIYFTRNNYTFDT